MKLLTEREQVRDVAKRWRGSYGSGTYGADKRKRNVSAELDALDPEKATAAQVAEIVGNGSWVSKESCHECGAPTWELVQLGQEPDYESSTANVCKACLLKALNLLEAA